MKSPANLRFIDIHTRKLRYFLAVAEELHFSRAAARVFLTQQALSRQIRELENALGVQLFVRTTRSVALTSAGESFAVVAAAILDQLDRSVEELRRTTRALSGRLKLGFCPGAALELTLPILDAFRLAAPEVELEMREFPIGDPSAGLGSGATDLAIVRLPQRTDRLETRALFTDPTIAVVSSGHALASRGVVGVSDLIDETLTLSNTNDEVYRAFWSLRSARRPDGAEPRFVAVESITEEETLVATGAAVAMTSSAVSTYTPVPGVRYLEVSDWPGSTVALAWHAGERSEIVATFVDLACEVRDREHELVARMEHRRPDPGAGG